MTHVTASLVSCREHRVLRTEKKEAAGHKLQKWMRIYLPALQVVNVLSPISPLH